MNAVLITGACINTGVAIVEKLTEDKREFSAPGLVVSQNRKMGNVTMVFYVREDNE